jgi:hypothetical protein
MESPSEHYWAIFENNWEWKIEALSACRPWYNQKPSRFNRWIPIDSKLGLRWNGQFLAPYCDPKSPIPLAEAIFTITLRTWKFAEMCLIITLFASVLQNALPFLPPVWPQIQHYVVDIFAFNPCARVRIFRIERRILSPDVLNLLDSLGFEHRAGGWPLMRTRAQHEGFHKFWL